MILEHSNGLAGYAEELASTGRTHFARQEAMDALGLTHGAFLDAAARLAKRGHLFAPRRGFYVITPTRFLKWGAPPPTWYIDAMMEASGRPYYVALLKAAELQGAAHQAVMEFQIVTDRQWKPIRAGRSKLVFYFRKDIGAVEAGIERRKTDTGSMRISSPALTALDLLRYRQASGGLDHTASVLNELASRIDPEQLLSLAPTFERSVVQRLGYVLDHLGSDELAAALHGHLYKGTIPWVELDPGEADTVIEESEPQRDRRWHVIVRRPIEIDEQ
ncbi:type IV toxin-antitoxin system AbiEi family antitoxin [Pararhizobium sp. IMCC21322]|uniref:type IV toxin-antitoxin system AbiEi family antitoxin domain-containing protein n=1 Tax=Pararhizobium sp. IMCC21322 TaxID=3067903 RepID=UPI00274206F6|nr:type IV toxin-antitoxin system AbiEi family antitoxin [Pararhizobium sp. IMCC21322]